MSQPRHNLSLIEQFIGSTGNDCFADIFSDYLDRSDWHYFALVNSNLNQFFNQNIYTAVHRKLANACHRYNIATYNHDKLNDIPLDVLYILLSFFENQFPTLEMKRNFTKIFSSPAIRQMNNIYFWQLVFSRLLDMLGVEHSPENAKKQFITTGNIEAFKNFIVDINQLSDFAAFRSYNLTALNIGGIGHVINDSKLFDRFDSFLEILDAAEQDDLSNALNEYRAANYFKSVTVYEDDDRSAKEIYEADFIEELGDLIEYFFNDEGQIIPDLFQLYVEDKKKANWVISELKRLPKKYLNLFTSDFFKDHLSIYKETSDNSLALVGAVYAASQFGNTFDNLLDKSKELIKIKKIPPKVVNDYIDKIKMTVMLEAAETSSVSGIDALLDKLNHDDFQTLLVKIIMNYSGNFEKCIFALFKSVRHWNLNTANLNILNEALVMLTADNWSVLDDANLAFSFRPKSLLWQMDINFLKKFITRKVGHIQRLDSNLLVLLSDSDDAINRLDLLGNFAPYFNCLYKAIWYNTTSLLQILKLPNALFKIFLSEFKEFDKIQIANNEDELLNNLTTFLEELHGKCELINIYHLELHRYAYLPNFHIQSEKLQNLLSDCSIETIFLLATRKMSQKIHHAGSLLTYMQNLLAEDPKKSKSTAKELVKFIIQYCENEEVYHFLSNTLPTKENIASLIKFKEAFIAKMTQPAEAEKEAAAEDHLQIMDIETDQPHLRKRKKDDEDEGYSSDESPDVKRPKR